MRSPAAAGLATLRIAGDASLPMKDRVDAVSQLRRQGFVAEASAALTLINSNIPNAIALRSLLDQVVAGESLRREMVGADDATPTPNEFPHSEIGLHIIPRPDAIGTLVTFGGVGRLFVRLHEPGEEAYNKIELRDPLSRAYLSSVPGLGTHYTNCMRNLRNILRGMGSVPRYFVGFSLGGYAALRYGIDLGAKRVLVFNGTPSLDLSASIPGDGVAQHPILRKMDISASVFGVDLVPRLCSEQGVPEVIMVHGAEHARDTLLAQLVSDVPNARVLPIRGFSGHNTYEELRHRGEAAQLIAEFLE
jgi:hypothetical protein